MYYRAEASRVRNQHGYTHIHTHTKCIHISYVLPRASISKSKLPVEIACHPPLYLYHAVKIAFIIPTLVHLSLF